MAEVENPVADPEEAGGGRGGGDAAVVEGTGGRRSLEYKCSSFEQDHSELRR